MFTELENKLSDNETMVKRIDKTVAVNEGRLIILQDNTASTKELASQANQKGAILITEVDVLKFTSYLSLVGVVVFGLMSLAFAIDNRVLMNKMIKAVENGTIQTQNKRP